MGEAVGVIGLGVMGAPMARNLLRAGHEVTVHSRSQGPVQRLVEEGAAAAATPGELAGRADVIVAMLPGEQVTAALLDGDEGLWAGARAGSILVDMGTASPGWARSLARAGRRAWRRGARRAGQRRRRRRPAGHALDHGRRRSRRRAARAPRCSRRLAR